MTRTYRVTFNPCEPIIHEGQMVGVKIRYSLRDPADRVEVTATSIADLLGQIETLAQERPGGVAAGVDITDGGRKPAGFDKATRNLTYGVEVLA